MKKTQFLLLSVWTIVLLLLCSGMPSPTHPMGQVLEVYDANGSAAKARLIIDGEEIFTTDVFIGSNGLGKEREGDRKTPVGRLKVKGAFGICENPGTAIAYTHVTSSIFACGDKAYYNQVIDTAVVHHPHCKGEDMSRYVPDYNYGLMTSYNEECVWGLGAAIFVHCKGNKPYTAGCIAFDEDKMIEILTRCDSTLIIDVKP